MSSHIITFSGVHGVGKSRIIQSLHSRLNFKEGKKRSKNNFLTPFEAMLFFIAAFSDRDKSVNINNDVLYVLDRYSYVDIKVYLDSLYALSYISNQEYNSLASVLNQSYSSKFKPSCCILLDDSPENILNRIERFRTPSKHHLFERDLRFIKKLRESFIESFKNLQKSSDYEYHIVSVDYRDPSFILDEIVIILNKLFVNKLN